MYPGGHSSKFITPDIDLVVYPTGPIPGNSACEKTKELGIENISLSKLLGIVTSDLKTTAVAGTHGKTTTTDLIAWMIKEVLGEPNFVLGGADDYILDSGKNWNVSDKSEYFVVEACEYKKQFLDRAPHPFVSVITHIDLDHTDFYKGQKEYNSAFTEFLSGTVGKVVIDPSKVNEKDVLSKLTLKLKSKIVDVNKFESLASKIPFCRTGEHNKQNLLRVCAVGEIIGLPKETVISSLSNFPGLSMRFEFCGNTSKGSWLFKDYAHNPQKIKMCLAGARKMYPAQKKILVFQPHSYERSFTFRREFSKAVSKADVVIIIPNIYLPPRETEAQRKMISGEDFTRLLKKANPKIKVCYGGTFEKTIELVRKYDNGGSIIILASAGDLHKISNDLKVKKVVCVGIGGGALYYVGLYLHYLGVEVVGYDISTNERTNKLEELGIKVNYSNPRGAFEKNVDLAVYSNALPDVLIKNMTLENKNVPFVEVGIFFDSICQNYEKGYLTGVETRAFVKSEIAPLYSIDYNKNKFIGVTGTDGKTTTASMIYHILSFSGKKCALVSTVSAIIDGQETDTGLHTTTPPQQDLFKLITSAQAKGCSHIILEITSRSLAMGRVAGVKLDTAVYTNITSEHLDYHKTWKNYALAKLRMSTQNLKPGGNIILNADDKRSYRFLTSELAKIKAGRKPKIFSYTCTAGKKANFKGTKILENNTGVNYLLLGNHSKRSGIQVKIPVVGKFNVCNSLAALSAACTIGEDIYKGVYALQGFKGVLGRMTIIQKKPFYVIVDFAHTPNALENALKTAAKMKKSSQHKLIVIFGCAGKRDFSKRAEMGKISVRYADVTILTAEDPRTEKLKDINDQISMGWKLELKKKGLTKKLQRFDNDRENVKSRRDAIEFGVNNAEPGDVVIICGKAHEKSLCFGTTEYPWNDIDEVKKLVSSPSFT